jgi:2,4-dienoyl-CoA reductase (NADPH2)
VQLEELARWYDVLLSQGVKTHFNYAIFRNPITGPLFTWLWRARRGRVIEGINLAYSARIREEMQKIAPDVPVLCTGGFQHASAIANGIRSGACDGVTIGRPLIANNDLPEILKTADGPAPGRECTYCNRCLFNDLENPLGCYEVSRFPGKTFEEQYDNMLAELMSVFEPPTYTDENVPPLPAREGTAPAEERA